MKIDVARRVDEIEHIGFAGVLVIHRYRGGLDCDASLTLDIHIVEKLVLLLAVAHQTGDFHYAVGQRAFAVVDMCDY